MTALGNCASMREQGRYGESLLVVLRCFDSFPAGSEREEKLGQACS